MTWPRIAAQKGRKTVIRATSPESREPDGSARMRRPWPRYDVVKSAVTPTVPHLPRPTFTLRRGRLDFDRHRAQAIRRGRQVHVRDRSCYGQCAALTAAPREAKACLFPLTSTEGADAMTSIRSISGPAAPAAPAKDDR